MFHTILLQAATAVTDSLHQGGITPPPAALPPKEETFMGLIADGGPFMVILMIILTILLVVAVFFTIERLIVVSKAGSLDRNFMFNIRDYLLNGNIESAKQLCRSDNSPVAHVIEKGISRVGKPTKEISEAMEIAGRVEVTRAEKNIHMISLVARIAPMLGFIGTIIGVIVIFHDLANSNGDVSIQQVSHGLYLKMFSSAAGLTVGVFAYMMYHFVNAMVDGVAKKIERSSLEFLDVINEPGK